MDRRELEALSLQDLRDAAVARGVLRAARLRRQALIDVLLEIHAGEALSAPLPPESLRSIPDTAPTTPASAAGGPLSPRAVPPTGVDRAGGAVDSSVGAAEPPGVAGLTPLARPGHPPHLGSTGAPGSPTHLSTWEELEPSSATLSPPMTEIIAAVAVAGQEVHDELEAEAEAAVEPYIDRGSPLPARLNTDYLAACPRDPNTVLILWELSDETRNRPISDGSGREFLAGSWQLRVLGNHGEVLASPDVDWHGNWWVHLPPDKPGVACIGAESPAGRFCPVLWSQPFRTPRAAPSDDHSVRWLRVEQVHATSPAASLIRPAPAMPGAGAWGERRRAGLEQEAMYPERRWSQPAGSGAWQGRGAQVRDDVATAIGPGPSWVSGLEPPLAAAPLPELEWTGASQARPDRSGWEVLPVEQGPVSAEQVAALGGRQRAPSLPEGSSDRLITSRAPLRERPGTPGGGSSPR